MAGKVKTRDMAKLLFMAHETREPISIVNFKEVNDMVFRGKQRPKRLG